MAYEMTQKVLFRHCDPAGIVFFPRYFEMTNDCVEAFFSDVVGVPFEVLHADGSAVPTAEIRTRFAAPSRHGDALVLRLAIEHVGGASARYRMTAHADQELRFETEATLVYIGPDGRPVPWPDSLRRPLDASKEPAP